MNRIFNAVPALLLIAPAVSAGGAEFARNANFVVLAEEPGLAGELLEKAEQFRRQVSREWLGQTLPDGVGPAMINVRLSRGEERGLTWATEPDSARRYHRVWLTTSRAGALGPVLQHELTHVVLATWLPQRLPPWAEEGAASSYDDAGRIALRRKTIAWFAQSGNWPRLAHVLSEETITADELASYAVAASLTEFLLSRGDRATFLHFAADGKQHGWHEALRQHYRLEGVDALQAAWQQWVTAAADSAE